MTEPPPPASQAVALANATGLPATIKARAMKWLLQLIGGTLAAPIVAEARERMDDIEGRSRVNMLMAEAVARQAIADPDTMERAKARFLSDHFRKQENLEAVAAKAVEALGVAAPESGPVTEEVDEDWLNVFSRYAEDASSDRLRHLWGKVLAGQIRQPGQFSPRTLRFVAELDQVTAKSFEEIAPLILQDFLVKPDAMGGTPLFSKLLSLEDAGLVLGVSGSLQKIMKGSGEMVTLTGTRTLALAGVAPADSQQGVAAIIVTKVGQELASLVSTHDERAALLGLADKLKPTFTELWLGPIVQRTGDGFIMQATELVWRKPVPDAA